MNNNPLYLPYFLNPFVGDVSGLTPRAGLVPPPVAGDAAAGKYLDAAGGWSVPPGVGGGVTTVGNFDTQASNANGAVISGANIYFQSATTSNPGMINATTQSFAGNKTFTGSMAVSLGFAVGTTASGTAGRLQTTGISKFGSSSAFTTIASHEFVWVSAVGSFIDIYLTGTMTNVSAGGAQAGLQVQNTFASSSGSWTSADGVYSTPAFALGANLAAASCFKGLAEFSGSGGLTITDFAVFRQSPVAIGSFTGTITNMYGFKGEALNLGTNRYGGYFIAPAGGTIAIACRADNLAVGYNVTPPASGAIISGLVAIGTSTPSTLTRLTITSATTDRYAIFLSGTLNADDGSATVGFYNNITLSPTNNNRAVYGATFFGKATPVGTNTILLGTAADFQLQGTLGSGTVNAGYSARFFNPTIGTTKTALYSDNISVGFSGFTPATNGLHVSGISSFGTSVYLSDATIPVQLNATVSNERYFAANKAGASAALFGFTNGGSLGTGTIIRCATTDPIYFYTNGTTLAAQINSSQQFMINTATPDGASKLTVAGSISVPSTRSDGFNYIGYNETPNAGIMRLVSANVLDVASSAFELIHIRGTIASPSSNLQGDLLGVLSFQGYNDGGTGNYGIGAYIYAEASANWNSTQKPADLVFINNPIGSLGGIETLRLSANGNVVCGSNNGSPLSTSATNGFLYVPYSAGPPTGIATVYGGSLAIEIDDTNKQIYVRFSDGVWRKTAALT